LNLCGALVTFRVNGAEQRLGEAEFFESHQHFLEYGLSERAPVGKMPKAPKRSTAAVEENLARQKGEAKWPLQKAYLDATRAKAGVSHTSDMPIYHTAEPCQRVITAQPSYIFG
jgi:hypothetical protein